jgi:hypothetical protein
MERAESRDGGTESRAEPRDKGSESGKEGTNALDFWASGRVPGTNHLGEAV